VFEQLWAVSVSREDVAADDLNAMEGRPLPVYAMGCISAIGCMWRIIVRGFGSFWKRKARRNVQHRRRRAAAQLDVVHLVCDVVDRLCPPLATGSRRGLITYVKDRPGHDRRYAIDASKIRMQLGWKAAYDFPSGLEQTVRWYLEIRNGWR